MGNCLSISLNLDSSLPQCWECTGKRAKYVCELENNLEALKKSLEELTDAKNDLLSRVNVAEEQPQVKRLHEVQRWISRAEDMEAQINQLILHSEQEVSKLCLSGCCSKNYMSSYKFGKELSEKLAQVIDLRSKGVFQVVANEAPVPSVVELPLEPTVGLETLFEKVCRDLSDESVGIMGLYGMGGVGKTTLLKKINNDFLKTTLSNYSVFWVVVSKDHSLENIQNALGQKIGCSGDTWRSKDSQQKAADIYNVLKGRRFVLLLDDIWERVDLTKLGVPLPKTPNNGSKVVFTTRSRDVCGRMHADKKVEVKCLTWDKSWELFQEMVGQEALNVHPDIPSLAKTVAEECAGLPLALITIGRAMACKRTPQEWNYAIQVLKNSASEFSGMGDEVLPLLKFSYDSLPSEKVRSCFLYCALFPEDYLITKNRLINLWMGEGFLDEYADINRVQDQGYEIIGTLVYACLLEEISIYGSECVQMHDVIRDMALWIACGCGKATNNNVLVQAKAQLSELPAAEKWSEVSRLSLMKNSIESLSGNPMCPNLSTLLLRNNKICEISDNFFESMPKLKVLDLSGNFRLRYLPAGVSKLVSLHYLDLSFTNIEELPRELSSLVSLKYLYLNYASGLDIIPKEVISSFSRLQVLDVFLCGTSERIVEDSVQCGGNELLVKELQLLKNLNALRVSIKSVSVFELFCASKKLVSCTQGLCLQHLSRLQFLNVSSFIDLKLLDELCIRHCTSLEDVKIDWGLERRESIRPPHLMISSEICFQKLATVSIVDCPKLKDLTWLIFAPNLRYLWVDSCSALEEIIQLEKAGDGLEVTKNLEPFVNLRTLSLHLLPSLNSICQKPLPCPEFIRVIKCEKLKKLPVSSNMTNVHRLTIEGEESWWNQLEWEDEATREAFLPCFRR